MADLQFLTSVISVFLGALVLRAYMPHIQRGQLDDPVLWLAIGFVGVGAGFAGRSFYWDVVWYIQGNNTSTPLVNIGLNTLVIASQMCALRARYLTIPEADRKNYNIFTAAFYPAAFWRTRGIK